MIRYDLNDRRSVTEVSASIALLSANINTEVYITIILPVVLCGCET
jgi:hypothetical protein